MSLGTLSPSALERGLAELGRLASGRPDLDVVALGEVAGIDPLRAALGGALQIVGDPSVSAPVFDVAKRATPGHPVVLIVDPDRLWGEAYGAVRDAIAIPSANVKILAASPRRTDHRALPDGITLARGLPHLEVLAPADAASAASVVREVVARAGPAYVALVDEPTPELTTGSLAVGRADELRAGNDLAIVASGPVLAVALAVADELGRTGVNARVLDLSSVKPFDAAAILKAARETRAILTLEETPAVTGLGTLVAAIVAENTPVLVRRLGVPDLDAPPGTASERRAAAGVTRGRALEEAWELLRAKGKVE